MVESAVYYDNRGNAWIAKDPDAELDYPFNWGDWLADVGDAMVSVEFIAEGVTAAPIGIPENGVAGVMVSGGEVGQAASVTGRIVTAEGRKDDRTLHFKIVER